LSIYSFNALLKILEESPDHVKFLLATTDPQKLPVTILSRCLQFNLKNLAPAVIVEHLQLVLGSEQIAHDESALWQLAKAAKGSMRDALTLVDQAISFGGGEVREHSVTALLGVPDQRVVLRCIEALRDRDAARLLAESEQVAEYNPDYAGLLEQMLHAFHRLAVAQQLPAAIDNSQGDRDSILALARSLSGEDVQLYYQIALNSLQDMALAPDRRMAFEMALLRMLAFTPEQFARTAPLPSPPAPDTANRATDTAPAPVAHSPSDVPGSAGATTRSGVGDSEKKKSPNLNQSTATN
jgi:DNA polymerase-3 subunit gamma/tau